MPIRPGGRLEIYDGAKLCYQVDVALLVDILATHIRTARLIEALQTAGPTPFTHERFMLASDTPVPRKPLAEAPPRPVDAERREELRAKRRSRKRGAQMIAGAMTALSHLAPVVA